MSFVPETKITKFIIFVHHTKITKFVMLFVIDVPHKNSNNTNIVNMYTDKKLAHIITSNLKLIQYEFIQ